MNEKQDMDISYEDEIAAQAKIEEERAKAEEEVITKKRCIKAYAALEHACELIEKDPEAASRDVYWAVEDVWKEKYPQTAEKHLPLIYKRFMELWGAWLKKDWANIEARRQQMSWWERIFG